MSLIQKKKFRSFERKQERIERADLIKKYEDIEILQKFKLSNKQQKIQKKIEKITTKCQKINEIHEKHKQVLVKSELRFLNHRKKCEEKKKFFLNQKKKISTIFIR